MGWSIGYDSNWNRDIGYGVPAYCDHPKCAEEIDRGLSYVCGGEPYGGEKGCGLYFCSKHLNIDNLCKRCRSYKPPYKRIKPEHPKWLKWKLIDESWHEWRNDNPEEVNKIKEILNIRKIDAICINCKKRQCKHKSCYKTLIIKDAFKII